MAGKTRYKDVFRAKRQSQGFPKVGVIADIKVGDLVTFSLAGPLHSRYVKSIHDSYLTTYPLESKYGRLDESRKVPFREIYEAVRPLDPDPWQPKAEGPKPKKAAPKPEPKPTPKPAPKPKKPPKAKPIPKPTPAPKPKPKRKRKKKKPPVGLMEFLDGGYKD